MSTPAPMPDAVLLDMDGTIVDSSAAVERAWAAFAADHGLDPAIVLATCHGNATKTTIRVHLPAADEATVDKIAAVHLAREVGDVAGIGPIEGARELIVLLESHGVPWAVVTNSPPTLAAARLGAAGFDPPVLVTAGDVDHPKPAPDGYELAAALSRPGGQRGRDPRRTRRGRRGHHCGDGRPDARRGRDRTAVQARLMGSAS